jgi:hypothetical protein
MGLAGATVGTMWPLKVRAAENGGKVTPRNNARNVVFYEISGAISHLDTFDFKDNPAVPKDFSGPEDLDGYPFSGQFSAAQSRRSWTAWRWCAPS